MLVNPLCLAIIVLLFGTMAEQPAMAQSQATFIDALAPDPLANLGEYLGKGEKDLRSAFPSRNGFALRNDCWGHLSYKTKNKQIYQIFLGIEGERCFELGMNSLHRAYGAPAVDGYGYATAIAAGAAVTTIGQSIMVLRWCSPKYDVTVVQPARSWREGINIAVSRSGWWNPKTGKRLDPASPEYRASCRPKE